MKRSPVSSPSHPSPSHPLPPSTIPRPPPNPCPPPPGKEKNFHRAPTSPTRPKHRYTVQEGSYLWSLAATDGAGLRASADFAITVDRTPPVSRVFALAGRPLPARVSGAREGGGWGCGGEGGCK